MVQKFESQVFPIITLSDSVAFPGGILPLVVASEAQISAIEAAREKSGQILIGYLKELPEDDKISSKDLYSLGVVADIIQVITQPDQSMKLLLEARSTARMIEILNTGSHLEGYAANFSPRSGRTKEYKAMISASINKLKRFTEYSDSLPKDLYQTIITTKDPLRFVQLASHYVPLSYEEKIQILLSESLDDQFISFLQFVDHQIDILQLEDKISQRVDQSMGKNQREYYLNEQLKAIENELGVGPENDPELRELEEAINKADLPEAVYQKAERELRRLARMQTMSPEAAIARTYIEWLTDVPWHQRTNDQLDLDEAKKILDKDHFGLEKIKERIIEFLAVVKLAGMGKGSILCLVGPPGVGKTSLGQSIAKCMGRKFARIALGGVRDEAEIRGHRRTYIGAMPGRIVQAMKKAGVVNPVILLDEVDKMSSDFRGDPASAMLEVLDPEQNNSFNDHYLDCDYDLSNVMFVTTANSLAGIPVPLQDRLEIIRVAGYTEYEKYEIAKQHLIPKQREKHGLKASQFKMSKSTILNLTSLYTREAGVRNLERVIAQLCRKVAKQVVNNPKTKPKSITNTQLPELLGPEQFSSQDVEKKPAIGHVLGLAWTEAGGELLPVESTLMPGKGNLTLTGQLGDVMQESAKAAFSFGRSRSKDYGLIENFHEKFDVHLHVPEGAIPKDGPSAGVTMATSLISLLSSVPVRQNIAMTGEITLQGRVLKIGGLKEKLLAAHRRRILEVIIPQSNAGELVEIPKEILKDMKIHPVERIEQVLDLALDRKPAKKKTTSRKKSSSRTAKSQKRAQV